MTKWKKRGPAEAVAVSVPTRSSVPTAAWVPVPSSGSARPLAQQRLGGAS